MKKIYQTSNLIFLNVCYAPPHHIIFLNLIYKMKIKTINNICKSHFKSNVIAILIFVIFLISFFPLFRNSWFIVFWDIDIGFYVGNYMDRIFPLWNETWSTSNFFNATRVFYVAFVTIISSIFWFEAEGFWKTMVATFLFLS